MLKYLYTKEIFLEVPSEISLGVSITGCTIHCYGCHSRELWEDKGNPLTIEKLQEKYSKDYKFEKTSPVMYKITKL